VDSPSSNVRVALVSKRAA